MSSATIRAMTIYAAEHLSMRRPSLWSARAAKLNTVRSCPQLAARFNAGSIRRPESTAAPDQHMVMAGHPRVAPAYHPRLDRFGDRRRRGVLLGAFERARGFVRHRAMARLCLACPHRGRGGAHRACAVALLRSSPPRDRQTYPGRRNHLLDRDLGVGRALSYRPGRARPG